MYQSSYQWVNYIFKRIYTKQTLSRQKIVFHDPVILIVAFSLLHPLWIQEEVKSPKN